MQRLQRDRIGFDERRRLRVEVLRDCGQAEGGAFTWPEQQRGAPTINLVAVDVLGDVRRPIWCERRRAARRADRVNETAVLAVASGRPERERPTERDVDGKVGVIAKVAAVHGFDT